MALLIETNDDRNPGATMTAYAKVIGIHGERFESGQGKALITFAYFASADAAQAKAARIGEPVELWADIDLSLPIHPQAYAALKAHDPVAALLPEKAGIERRAIELQARIDEVQARLDSGTLEGAETASNQDALQSLNEELAGLDEERAAFGPKYEEAETFRARLQAAKDA